MRCLSGIKDFKFLKTYKRGMIPPSPILVPTNNLKIFIYYQRLFINYFKFYTVYTKIMKYSFDPWFIWY